MKIEHFMAARLTLDNGAHVILKRLGGANDARVYTDLSGQYVYSVRVAPPARPMEFLGALDGTSRRVYREPFRTRRK